MNLYSFFSPRPYVRRIRWSVVGLKIGYYKLKEQERKMRNPHNLMNYEKHVYSQFREDGIIEEIFKRIGTMNRYFVEFGSAEGNENNTRYLLEENSWQGLWIEGSQEAANTAREHFHKYPVKVLNRFITRENILAIFAEANVPKEPDFLSIDLDGNDYWVWQEILMDYKPRVVCIEYNANISPRKSWIMPYNKDYIWDNTRDFGASLKALNQLGKQHGYVLVGCESTGVNAFFCSSRCHSTVQILPHIELHIPRYTTPDDLSTISLRDPHRHAPKSCNLAMAS